MQHRQYAVPGAADRRNRCGRVVVEESETQRDAAERAHLLLEALQGDLHGVGVAVGLAERGGFVEGGATVVDETVSAEERCGDELLRADQAGGRDQGARTLRAQAVRRAHVTQRRRRLRQRGELVDDRVRPGPVERIEQRWAVENVGDDLGRTRRGERAGSARDADDLVACGLQRGNQVATDGPRSPSQKYAHASTLPVGLLSKVLEFRQTAV